MQKNTKGTDNQGVSDRNFNELLSALEPLPGLPDETYEVTKKYLAQGYMGNVSATSIQVESTASKDQGYSIDQQSMLYDLACKIHVALSFADRLSERTLDKHRPLIAVAGPAGAGKSTFALRMMAELTGQKVAKELWKDPMLQRAMKQICDRLPIAFLNVDRANLTGLIYPEVCKTNPDQKHDATFYHEYTWGARFLGAYAGHLATQWGLAMVDDATYGSPGAFNRVTAVKAQGRPAYGIVIAASDAVRKNAIRNREALGYIQSDGRVTSQQAAAFAENLPFLFDQFDRTDVMVRFGAKKAPTLAGTVVDDKVHICNLNAFNAFCDIYGADVFGSGRVSEYRQGDKSESVIETVRPAFRKLGAIKARALNAR